LNSWPFHTPAQWTNCANWHKNWFIRFQNTAFTTLWTNKWTGWEHYANSTNRDTVHAVLKTRYKQVESHKENLAPCPTTQCRHPTLFKGMITEPLHVYCESFTLLTNVRNKVTNIVTNILKHVLSKTQPCWLSLQQANNWTCTDPSPILLLKI